MIGDDALAVLARCSSDLRGIELIPGAGHFVQQEQPEAFNRALLRFLDTLPARH
jgi:pimeloyl-ACP methyl ester carboxylesterase